MPTIHRRLGLLLLLGSAVSFSFGGFFTRLIELDVWTVLFWRGIFGGLTILAFIGWELRCRTLAAFTAMRRAGIAVALCSAIATICFINALRQTTVAEVLVIGATTPFFTAAFAWIWASEREHGSTILASAAALLGIAVMVHGSTLSGRLAGDALAFAMVLLIAAMMVIIRANRHVSMLPAACLSGFLCALFVFPVSSPGSAQGMTIVNLMLFGVTQFGLGLLLLTVGLRTVSSTRSALIGILETPLAAAWVWIAFGEVPAVATITGGAIVMVAVLGDILAKKD